MNEKTVIIAEGYNRIDGRDAYRSAVKRLTLGAPIKEHNQNTPIAAQIWREVEGELVLDTELPIHQVFDLMILLGRSLLHFKEAYRLPLLYDPQKPIIERVGVQGGAMPIAVNTDNPSIDADIKAFSQALSNMGELTGERLRVLTRILEEMEY